MDEQGKMMIIFTAGEAKNILGRAGGGEGKEGKDDQNKLTHLFQPFKTGVQGGGGALVAMHGRSRTAIDPFMGIMRRLAREGGGTRYHAWP